MAYSTEEEVRQEFKNLQATVNTALTPAVITRFITEADGEIDAVLATRYQVPVAAAECAALLRTISIGLTAGRMKRILEVKGGNEATDQIAKAEELRKEARELLRGIQKQEMALLGATPVTSHQGVSSFNVGAGVCHIFKRDEDQW